MKKHLRPIAALSLGALLFATPLSSTQAVQKQQNLTHMVQTTSDDSAYEKNKLIIRSTKEFTARELKQLNATKQERISAIQYTVLSFKSEKAWKAAIPKLAKMKQVERISLSPIYKKLGNVDPKATKQALHKLLQSPAAQKLQGKNKIKVAVIDEGVDATHPDLQKNIVATKNTVNPLHVAEKGSHGTHVAGIIGAVKNNGIGGYGLNPNAQILGYDVFNGSDGAYDYIISKAIIQATKDGAKVINMSLGSASPSPVMDEAIAYAHEKGVTVIAAAGNTGTDQKQYPASYKNVISVGSVGNTKKLSDFSSYGVSTDIVAPGEDIYSTSYQKRGASFEKMSGTSMASPVVAGIASLILSKNPNLTPDQVEYILEHTATDLGEKGFDAKYGFGLVNPVKAMQFNPKNIPVQTTKQWNDEEIKHSAEDATFNKPVTKSLKQRYEQQWVRVNVTKGQPIQLTVKGDKLADLQLDVRFYGDESSQKAVYNSARENEVESKYIEAPFDGVMTVGVSDVNGRISQSPYALDIQTGMFPEDESSREQVAELTDLNTTIDNQYFQPLGEVDEDVFHFKATKDELVSLTLSNIPNVTTSVIVYDKQGFNPPEDATEEVSPIVQGNSLKANTENTLSFATKAGEDYYIVLKNTADAEITFEQLLQMMMSGQEPNFEMKPESALFPYEVTFATKAMPADEDQLPYVGEEELNFENEVEQIKALGRPFDLSKEVTGHLQGSSDYDAYHFKTNADGIYKLHIQTKNMRNLPNVVLAEAMTETVDGQEMVYLEDIYDNTSDYAADGSFMMMGLKANTEYVLRVDANYDQTIPFDGYTLKAETIKTKVADSFEANNQPEQAASFPKSGKLIANVSTFNDVDFYYYEAPKTGIYSVDYQLKNLTKNDLQTLPTLLHNRYISTVRLILDKNHNKRLDANEMESSIYLEDMQNDLSLHSGVEMKKGEHYFVAVQPTAFEAFMFSARPYELAIQAAPSVDEDAKSVVKNNKPSKPIAFKKKSTSTVSGSAYMNAGFTNGDADWFIYKATKKGKLTVTLDVPTSLDGVLEVYKDGKRLSKTDLYGDGDAEKLTLNASKGTYYFKVTDRLKRASIQPYTLTVKK